MPHIHTNPNQHDMTVSAYILLREDDEWKCLVHFHRKIEKLMQIGGHIELDETPWQAIAHELEEESGFSLDELQVLQPTADQVKESGNVTHPVPFSMNTHNVGNEHYHSDLCYGFIAKHRPRREAANGESQDLRWLTLDELAQAARDGEALLDVTHIYEFLVNQLDLYKVVPAISYSLKKPESVGVVYKSGAPGEL